MLDTSLVERLRACGVGRRRLDDAMFAERPPRRLGVYHDHDEEDEDPCHEELTTAPSAGPAAARRLACGACRRALPSPHLLDLHLQEAHDSYFAIAAARKPSYCCYIEECKEKFMTPEERLDHCVKLHKLPKDFRFDVIPKSKKNKAKPEKNTSENNIHSMEVDSAGFNSVPNNFSFTNSKQKAFTKYAGKKFTTDKTSFASINVDEIMVDLKENLPK